MRLTADTATLVVRALVVGAATALLYANPHGVPRVAAGAVFGSLVVAVAAGKHLKRCAASSATDDPRLAVSLQPPVPMQCLRPRQTPDDYDWYPDRVITDRAHTGRRRFGR